MIIVIASHATVSTIVNITTLAIVTVGMIVLVLVSGGIVGRLFVNETMMTVLVVMMMLVDLMFNAIPEKAC